MTSRTPSGTPASSSATAPPRRAVGVREVVDDLLDEERVALRLAVQLRRRTRAWRAVPPSAVTSAPVSPASSPPSVDPPQHALAAQAGEQRGERIAALVRAHGREEHRALGRRRAHEVADQLERREIRPVQVVEHHQQRRGAGDLRQQRGERVEEPQPLGALLRAAQRPAVAGRGHAELRQHDPELGGARPQPVGQRRERCAARPAAQHLHDRLVRRRRLLVEAPVQHDRAVGVRVSRQLGGEPGLPDAGLAGEHDEPAAAVRGLAPRRRRAATTSAARPTNAWRPRAASSGAGQRRARDGRDRRGRRDPARRRGAAVQQALVHRHRSRPRRRAELLAQQPAQVLERAHRLGRVARRLVRLHQQPVRGLAERRQRHGRAGRFGRLRRLAGAQRGVRQHLQRAHPQRCRAAALLVQPRAVAVGKERAEAVARARRAPQRPRRSSRRRAARARRAGPPPAACSTSIHSAPSSDEPELRPPRERALAERSAQLRQQRAQRRVGSGRRRLRPEHVDQLAARAGAVAVDREVGEQEPPLSPRQACGDVPAVHVRRPTARTAGRPSLTPNPPWTKRTVQVCPS